MGARTWVQDQGLDLQGQGQGPVLQGQGFNLHGQGQGLVQLSFKAKDLKIVLKANDSHHWESLLRCQSYVCCVLVQLSQLSASEAKVADVIGVSEGYVAKMASGRVPRMVNILTTCLHGKQSFQPTLTTTSCGLAPCKLRVPLIWFLTLALYILFACLYRMLPHWSFFLHFLLTYLLPYLSFPLRIDPLHSRAGFFKRRLNLACFFCF